MTLLCWLLKGVGIVPVRLGIEQENGYDDF